MGELGTLSARIAALFLIQDGEIRMSDIEALPFVDSKEFATIIAKKLMQEFDAEIYPRRTREAGLSFWEDVIRLKKPLAVRTALKT